MSLNSHPLCSAETREHSQHRHCEECSACLTVDSVSEEDGDYCVQCVPDFRRMETVAAALGMTVKP